MSDNTQRKGLSPRSGLILAAAGVLLIAIAAYVGWKLKQSHPDGPKPPPDMVTVMEFNTRGVAFMDQFKYPEAEAEFAKINEMAPEWIPGKINRAIAAFNQNSREKIDQAMGILKDVLAKDADNLHAHYCLGFLHAHYGNFVEAIPHFEAVTKLDPNDAGGWYQLGFVLSQKGDDDARATECFRKAHVLNPYMTGPITNLISRVPEKESQELIAELNRLRQANVSQKVSDAYTEQGSRYALVIGKPRADLPPLEYAPLPVCQPWDKFKVRLAAGARWATADDLGGGPLGDLRRAVRKRFGGTVVVLDDSRHGRLELFLISAVVDNGQVRDLLLRYEGEGVFVDVTKQAGLAEPRPSLGCAAADFDNSGRPSLLITGAGVQKLFRNKGDGTFEDVSTKAGLDQVKDVCLGAAWVDLDQDGDLDLLIARYAQSPESALAALSGKGNNTGGVLVFINSGEAPEVKQGEHYGALSVKFRRANELEAVFKVDGSATTLAITDADNDVDQDAIALADGAPATLMINDRLLRFRHAYLEATEWEHKWNGGLVLDVDQDERSDVLLLAAGKAPLLLMNRGVPGKPPANIYEKGAVNSPPLMQARVVDFDLDGFPDVIGLSDERRPVLLHNDRAGKLAAVPEALGPDRDWPKDLLAAVPIDLDGDGVPDLLTWSESSGLAVRRSLGNGNAAVKVRPMGRRERADPPNERTNSDGVGSRITLQSARQFTTCEVTTSSAGLGQSWEPLCLGMAKANLSEGIIRARWPDMAVQAEYLGLPREEWFSLEKGNVWELREFNRKQTSCPLLLTWDGEKWVCVTDFLGEASLGEMQAGGGTRPARRDESVKIEAHQLKPRDGEYTLRIAEPMDEVTYLDSLRLDVIDLPPGVDVFPDERFATSEPAPTQERLYFKKRYFAKRAIDHEGRDVTGLLRDRDRKMTAPSEYRSWLGFAGEHWVELDFGEQLKQIGPKDRVYLVLAGWTDYAYPESIFAAAQAGVDMVPPVLEKLGADGRWRKVCDVGFPAGLPRVMTRDVTGLLAGFTGKLRLRTNLRVFWDQIFIAPAIDVKEARVHELGVAAASLGYRGFLKEIAADKTGLIEYDPEKVESVPVTRWNGRLTRYGDVTELLAATDDRLVIIGPGDELAVRFDASKLPPLPAGWSRQFVLRAWGWCKDASPFTATGGEIAPLPFRAMKQFPPRPEEHYPHPEDLKKWHTRRPN